VPAYVRASRRLGTRSDARAGAVPDHVVLEGPIEGSVVIDAVVPVSDPVVVESRAGSEPVASGIGAR
jgi:hypothetical protein